MLAAAGLSALHPATAAMAANLAALTMFGNSGVGTLFPPLLPPRRTSEAGPYEHPTVKATQENGGTSVSPSFQLKPLKNEKSNAKIQKSSNSATSSNTHETCAPKVQL